MGSAARVPARVLVAGIPVRFLEPARPGTARFCPHCALSL